MRAVTQRTFHLLNNYSVRNYPHGLIELPTRALGQVGRTSSVNPSINATLVTSPPTFTDIKLRRPKTLSSADLEGANARIAYDLIQGAQAGSQDLRGRGFQERAGAVQSPPTAVLMHGIMGSKRNLQSYARMIVEGFPSWQVLVIDLRCHGESAALPARPPPAHTVDSAAEDVAHVLQKLRIFPHMLIGHSFGGKVAMSMVQQFGQCLPRALQVWVLDSLPGASRSGQANGRDYPGNLIQIMRQMPQPVAHRGAAIDYLLKSGFSHGLAQWAAMNLKPGASDGQQQWSWGFDLDGIADMFRSYEESSLWPLLESPPQGFSIDFVKAEGSCFRWAGPEEEMIGRLGHKVHLLPRSGHWVHIDNPAGLFDIMAPSFSLSPRAHSKA